MCVCVKAIPAPVPLCVVQVADECQVQNPSCPFFVLSTRVNWGSNQQQRFRVLHQFSEIVSAVRFVEVPLRQIKSCRPPSRPSATATSFPVTLSELPQRMVHTSTKLISVSVELSLLLLPPLLLLSAA